MSTDTHNVIISSYWHSKMLTCLSNIGLFRTASDDKPPVAPKAKKTVIPIASLMQVSCFQFQLTVLLDNGCFGRCHSLRLKLHFREFDAPSKVSATVVYHCKEHNGHVDWMEILYDKCRSVEISDIGSKGLNCLTQTLCSSHIEDWNTQEVSSKN